MNNFLAICVITLIILTSCLTSENKGMVSDSSVGNIQKEQESMLSKDEQAKEALTIFNTILSISQNEKREVAVAKKTELYKRIITKYPKAPLAQESYWRIIETYLRDYDPPRVQEALAMYEEFINKYDKSPVRTSMESTIVRFFYSKGMWNDLLAFVQPKIEHFIQTAELDSPTYMFLHAEAKYNLGDYEEAKKAYKIIIRYFPDTRDAKISAERLTNLDKDK